MPDRYDPAIPPVATDYPDTIPLSNSTATDSQAQSQVYAGYAPGDALADYTGGAVGPDIATEGFDAYDAYGDPKPVAQPRWMGSQSSPILVRGGLVLGWTFIDATPAGTGVAPFLVRFHDGTDASAPIVGYANQLTQQRGTTFPGFRVRWGLFAEVVTGVPNGVIYTSEDRAL